MLTQYGGYPAFELMYDTGGHPLDQDAQNKAVVYFGTGEGAAIPDLIVISHGWNSDIAEARTLYQSFFNAFSAVANQRGIPASRFGVVALFWPSKRFSDPLLIPGGAAALADPGATHLSAQLDLFARMFASDPAVDTKIAHVRSLIPLLNVSASAQDDYVSTLASLVPKPRYELDEGLDQARHAMETTPGHVVLRRLEAPAVPLTLPQPGTGGAAGLGSPGSQTGASGFGSALGGITAAAATLGDYLTYYTMKDRAGIIGRTGAAATIRALRASRAKGKAPNIHLVGHSFGCRLVTAAANALAGSQGETVQSMTLLEAAYSHNALAVDWDGQGSDGAFRGIVAQRKVDGPVLITHSVHDVQVGLAYPIASRLMDQAAGALIGGPDDLYGGMGRNGAQHTPEVLIDVALQALDGTYPPVTKKKWVVNINGDGPPPAPTISSHGDVTKPEIVSAMLSYIQ